MNGKLGVPEWKAAYGNDLKLRNGAEMYLQKGNNAPVYLGTYDDVLYKFVK